MSSQVIQLDKDDYKYLKDLKNKTEKANAEYKSWVVIMKKKVTLGIDKSLETRVRFTDDGYAIIDSWLRLGLNEEDEIEK